MDHHCLFSNSCIGLRNYCYFLRFVTATIFGLLLPVLSLLPQVLALAFQLAPAILTILGIGMGHTVNAMLPAALLEDFGPGWLSLKHTASDWDFVSPDLYHAHVFLAWFTGMVVLILNFNLWVFHMDLVLRNETTIENLENWLEQRRSPYDQGLLANFREVCGPTPAWCPESWLKAALNGLQWLVCGGRDAF